MWTLQLYGRMLYRHIEIATASWMSAKLSSLRTGNVMNWGPERFKLFFLPPNDRLGDNLDVVSCNLQTRSSPAQDSLDLFSFWFSLCVQAMVPNDIDRSPRCSRYQPPKHADMGCWIDLLKLHRWVTADVNFRPVPRDCDFSLLDRATPTGLTLCSRASTHFSMHDLYLTLNTAYSDSELSSCLSAMNHLLLATCLLGCWKLNDAHAWHRSDMITSINKDPNTDDKDFNDSWPSRFDWADELPHGTPYAQPIDIDPALHDHAMVCLHAFRNLTWWLMYHWTCPDGGTMIIVRKRHLSRFATCFRWEEKCHSLMQLDSAKLPAYDITTSRAQQTFVQHWDRWTTLSLTYVILISFCLFVNILYFCQHTLFDIKFSNEASGNGWHDHPLWSIQSKFWERQRCQTFIGTSWLLSTQEGDRKIYCHGHVGVDGRIDVSTLLYGIPKADLWQFRLRYWSNFR